MAGASSSNFSRGSSHTGETASKNMEHPRVRDIPTKRNLHAEFSCTSDGRTGERTRNIEGDVSSTNKARDKNEVASGKDLWEKLEERREKDLRDKLMDPSTRRYGPRKNDTEWQQRERSSYPGGQNMRMGHNGQDAETGRGNPLGGSDMHGTRDRRRGHYVRIHRRENVETYRSGSYGERENESRKRGPRQVWVAKGDPERYGDEDGFICDTRQKTTSVFDRIQENDDKAASPGTRGRRDQ